MQLYVTPITNLNQPDQVEALTLPPMCFTDELSMFRIMIFFQTYPSIILVRFIIVSLANSLKHFSVFYVVYYNCHLKKQKPRIFNFLSHIWMGDLNVFSLQQLALPILLKRSNKRSIVPSRSVKEL